MVHAAKPAKLHRNASSRLDHHGSGRVIMISGCRDDQTSADAAGASQRGAGGACTWSLKQVLKESDTQSYAGLLIGMNEKLKRGGYDQRPRLSTNQEFDLSNAFSIPEKSQAPYRALMIGINYVGMQEKLNGCHNDVKDMRDLFKAKGYDDDSCYRVLLDDGVCKKPTKDNIIDGMKWLVSGAKPGTTLFFHYSGHGGSIPDDNGDEDDNKDECLFPVDFKTVGVLRDDTVSQILVQHVPKDVTLIAVCDCCHSGTIMDLPFTYKPQGEAGEGEAVSHTKKRDEAVSIDGLGVPVPIIVAVVAVAVPIVIVALSTFLKKS